MKITVEITIEVDVTTSWPGSVQGTQVYNDAKRAATNIVDDMLLQSQKFGNRVKRKSVDKVLAVLTEIHAEDKP